MGGPDQPQVCDECLYLFESTIHQYSKGLIKCRGCQYWNKLVCYAADKNCRVVFECTGIDAEEHTIYIPTSTNAPLYQNNKSILKAAVCGVCEKQIPSWMIKYNKYVSNYFVVIEDE